MSSDLFASCTIAADDWGLSPAVNEGILELAQAGVIRRVSAFAPSRFFTHGLSELKKIPHLQLGLHFNLTYCAPYSSIGDVIQRRLFCAGRVHRTVIEEFSKQFQNFCETVGSAPSHVDGHQHVHLAVWDFLAPLLQEKNISQTRVPYDRDLWMTTKASLNLAALHVRRKLLGDEKTFFQWLPFAYPNFSRFRDHNELRNYLESHVAHEVLCHPAVRADFGDWSVRDPYEKGRIQEFLLLKRLTPEYAPSL